MSRLNTPDGPVQATEQVAGGPAGPPPVQAWDPEGPNLIVHAENATFLPTLPDDPSR